MDIINFDHIRVGSNWPLLLDIAPIDKHENFGIFARFSNLDNNQRRVELRRKSSEYALFLFSYKDQELPEFWKDSQLVWSLKQ